MEAAAATDPICAVTARRIMAARGGKRVLTASSSPRPRPSPFRWCSAFDVAQHEHGAIGFRERVHSGLEHAVELRAKPDAQGRLAVMRSCP